MSDTALSWTCVGAYVFSCFVAASVAKEFFGVSDSDDNAAYVPCGLFWPVVVAFWMCVGVALATWWLVNAPMRVIASERRRRRAAIAEVERILAPSPVPTMRDHHTPERNDEPRT